MKKIAGVENADSLGAIAEIYLPDSQVTPASVPFLPALAIGIRITTLKSDSTESAASLCFRLPPQPFRSTAFR
eukprot:231227-Pyramimonas_sp.AAC.1